MLPDEITTITDVEKFFDHLLEKESLNFHPDEDFENYINLNSQFPTYTKEGAEIRNRLMEKSFMVCEKTGIDIYQIGFQKLFTLLKIDNTETNKN